MPTTRELDTLRDIEIGLNAYKSNQCPAWRTIEKIAKIILEFQKQEWLDNHR